MNASFLQAHLSRRHPDHAATQPAAEQQQLKPAEPDPELVHQLQELREKLHLTELQLLEERNAHNDQLKKAWLM